MIPKADTTPEPKSEAGRVKAFFHGYAQDFDSIYQHNTKRGFLNRLIDTTFRKSMFLRFQEVLRNTSNPRIQTILDVGCGSGRYCLEFLKQGKQVVGMDLAEGMLELARQAISETPQAQNISFLQGDYLRHDFQQRFDAACLMGFFDYIQDPAAIFGKLKREVAQEIYASFPGSSGLLAKQRKLRYALRDCPLYLYSVRDIENIMRACGLEQQYAVKDLGREYFVKVTL